jgi:hypothetical protein
VQSEVSVRSVRASTIRVRRASIAHEHIALRDCGTQLVAESAPPNGIDGVEPCGDRDVLLKDVTVASDRNEAEDIAAVARHCAEGWHSPNRIRRQAATTGDWIGDQAVARSAGSAAKLMIAFAQLERLSRSPAAGEEHVAGEGRPDTCLRARGGVRLAGGRFGAERKSADAPPRFVRLGSEISRVRAPKPTGQAGAPRGV